uniref:Methyltransferase-like protein 22 n=1 Tax=Callorhinchus milii TaxID=7868 RepID=A0A4W3K1R0_CALMI
MLNFSFGGFFFFPNCDESIRSINFLLPGGDVTLTDQLPVLHQIARNVTTNISPEQIHRAKVRELAWGKELKCYPSDFDFILGSDIIYSKISFPLLLQTLLHLSSQNTIIYLSSEMKYKFIVDEAYVNLLTKYFNSEIVSRDNELDINLYRMTKKCPDTEIPQLCK